MFKQFYKDIDELREAIKRIRNVWIPFTPKWRGENLLKGEYMVDDKNTLHVRMRGS